jgi:hypothetical protein
MSNIYVFVPDVAEPYSFPEGMEIQDIRDVLQSQGVITTANTYTVEEGLVRFNRVVAGTKGL